MVFESLVSILNHPGCMKLWKIQRINYSAGQPELSYQLGNGTIKGATTLQHKFDAFSLPFPVCSKNSKRFRLRCSMTFVINPLLNQSFSPHKAARGHTAFPRWGFQQLDLNQLS